MREVLVKVFISVISHGHSSLINQLSCLSNLCENFVVVVKSNKEGDNFSNLLENTNFYWLNDRYGKGFGHNNNIVFEYCENSLGMCSNDYFIVLNPDVVIDATQIKVLIDRMLVSNRLLGAINLFKDPGYKIHDNSIRKFPSLYQFVKSFLNLGNDTYYDKTCIDVSCQVEWAAGSFLAFKASHFQNLGGFDQKYFMYCEDIDICYRSYLHGQSVTYYPDIKALHLGKHANRQIFSIHFYWHLSSVIRFLLVKANFKACKPYMS